MSKNIKGQHLNEHTTTSRSSGEYNLPLALGIRSFKKKDLQPFTERASNYKNAQLEYDSMDGSIDLDKHLAKKLEDIASKQSEYYKKHPIQSDEDGNNLNSGNGPNKPTKKINEDLRVWFGKKKKPKGSSQPKGPWVNICRKKEGGGHPPCGRSKATSKGYPKCRAAGVASRMTDAQKKSACQQKRKAEKTHSKSGTGNKPKMVSYKPKNESLKDKIKKVLSEVFNPDRLYPISKVNQNIQNAPLRIKIMVRDLKPIPCINKKGEKTMCVRVNEELYNYIVGKH